MINKLLSVAAFALLTTLCVAQNSAEVSKIEGKDVYIFLSPDEYSISELVSLTSDQVDHTKSLEERILLAHQSATQDYDALWTRDGKNIQLLKYKNSRQTEFRPFILSKKEIYFLSTPTKDYETIEKKIITESEMRLSFYNIAEAYTNKKSSTEKFDAIIVSENKVEYIKFK